MISKTILVNERGLCRWRDRLVDNTKVEDNKWYTHPVYTNYQANTNGEVMNKETYKLIDGSSNEQGRTTITIQKKKLQKHRFIIECLYNKALSDKYEIDHIDKNAGNNVFSNLQILTKWEHNKKTARTNPDKGKKAGKKMSIIIKKIKYDSDNKLIEEVLFESINDAANKENVERSTIKRRLKSSNKDSNGYIWIKADEDNDLEGEEWRNVPNMEDVVVSNMGRVQLKYLYNSKKQYGSLGEQAYYTISIKQKQYKVHNLIAFAFLPPKSLDTDTIDHIDKDSKNNCVSNLRWASKSEQAINRTNIEAIEVYNILTQNIIDTFVNKKECCDKYSVSASTLSTIVNYGITHFERGQLGNHKNLYVRQKNLKTEEKAERELNILNNEIDVLLKDKNKRKSNDEKLPTHITKSGKKYRLKITFRGETFNPDSHQSVEYLLSEKIKWVDEQKTKYIKIIDEKYK